MFSIGIPQQNLFPANSISIGYRSTPSQSSRINRRFEFPKSNYSRRAAELLAVRLLVDYVLLTRLQTVRQTNTQSLILSEPPFSRGNYRNDPKTNKNIELKNCYLHHLYVDFYHHVNYSFFRIIFS